MGPAQLFQAFAQMSPSLLFIFLLFSSFVAILLLHQVCFHLSLSYCVDILAALYSVGILSERSFLTNVTKHDLQAHQLSLYLASIEDIAT